MKMLFCLFQRLRSLVKVFMFLGTSITLYSLYAVNNWFSDPVANTLAENWQYVAAYFLIAGIISFGIVYRLGPIEDERSLTIIQWILQAIGLGLVYNSTQISEVSIALVIILLTVYNFPRVEIKNQRLKNIW